MYLNKNVLGFSYFYFVFNSISNGNDGVSSKATSHPESEIIKVEKIR